MSTTSATRPATLPASQPRSAPADPAARPYTAGVLGASGTSGAELVRLLQAHPAVNLGFATSRQHAGTTLDRVEPAAPPVDLRHPDEVTWGTADVVFVCLPHGSAGAAVRAGAEGSGVRVIDLSGDHRLRDEAAHARVYGSERAQSIADEAVYGLTEFVRDRLPGARFVANPGCYATAISLALAPLAERGLVTAPPVADGKSGVSGAGRAATATSHFCSVTEDVRPYRSGRAHRHVAEIEQWLGERDPSREHRVVFNPHLVPLDRGIEVTIVLRDVPGGASAVREALEERYRGEKFVRVLEPDREARIRGVARTNRADLSVFPVEGLDDVVVAVAIDNLLKGAAGQAVQNMNVMLGLLEELALPGAVRSGEEEEA